MRFRIYILIVSGLFVSVSTWSQKLPYTDLYMVHMYKQVGDVCFDKPMRVSKIKGYNNQPYFTPFGTMLYVSNDAKAQTDIFQYNIYTHKTNRITHTNNIKEYSPQLTPDHQTISCVRVEPDDTTQNLYTYSLRGNPEKKINNIPGQVGYYCWVDDEHVALFMLRKNNKHELILYNTHTQHTLSIAKDIGRCIQRLPNSNTFSFVQKSDTGWTLCRYDLKTGQQNKLLNMLPNTEDYAWTPDGKVWCMYEGRLNEATPHGLWHVVSDFCSTSIEKSYRIALSPDMQFMSVVVYTDTKP